MLIVNAKNKSCTSYYTLNPSFDHLGGSLSFYSVEIFDALKYLSLYKPFHRMGTDPVLTALVIHLCSEVDWKKLLFSTALIRTTSVRMKCMDWKKSSYRPLRRFRPMTVRLHPLCHRRCTCFSLVVWSALYWRILCVITRSNK